MSCGRLATAPNEKGAKEVMAQVVYNGKLYGSLWPTGEVYRYDGDQTWTHLRTLGRTGHGSKINCIAYNPAMR